MHRLGWKKIHKLLEAKSISIVVTGVKGRGYTNQDLHLQCWFWLIIRHISYPLFQVSRLLSGLFCESLFLVTHQRHWNVRIYCLLVLSVYFDLRWSLPSMPRAPLRITTSAHWCLAQAVSSSGWGSLDTSASSKLSMYVPKRQEWRVEMQSCHIYSHSFLYCIMCQYM